jgi:hypothetical protein
MASLNIRGHGGCGRTRGGGKRFRATEYFRDWRLGQRSERKTQAQGRGSMLMRVYPSCKGGSLAEGLNISRTEAPLPRDRKKHVQRASRLFFFVPPLGPDSFLNESPTLHFLTSRTDNLHFCQASMASPQGRKNTPYRRTKWQD